MMDSRIHLPGRCRNEFKATRRSQSSQVTCNCGMRTRLLLLVLSSCWGCMRPSEANSNPPKSKALWTGDEPTDGSGWAKCNVESKCTASIQALARQGRHGGRGLHLHVENGKWVGAGWSYPSMISLEGIDVTQFDVLSFWMRLEGKSEYYTPPHNGFLISLSGAGGKLSSGQIIDTCARETDDGWRHIVIPVANFIPLPSMPFDRKRVTGISVYTGPAGLYTFDLDLDDITFEVLDSKSLLTLCPAQPGRPIVPDEIRAEGSPNSTPTSTICPYISKSICVETELDSFEGSGRIRREAVDTAVHADYDQIRECYMAGVARHKSLCGEAHIKFTIDETGRVQRPQAIVGTTLPDCDVVKCIEGRFSQLQFPSPEGGRVTVVYPLRFVP